MQLTIATFDDRVISFEIEDNDSIDTLKAIIEAETAIPASQQVILHNGTPLSQGTLAAAGVRAGDLLMLEKALNRPGTSAPRHPSPPGAGSTPSSTMPTGRELLPDGSAANPEALMSMLRAVPAQLHQLPPKLRDAVAANDVAAFQTALREMTSAHRRAAEEEARLMRMAEMDPFNVEVQQRLEEAIRERNIAENLESAMEHNPEVFGSVIMLYVNMQVNGVPLKAFIDSGAQITIMNQKCAERCGVLRLLDRRFKGVARGVGSAQIIGRVHMAPLQAGGQHFPISITVLEHGPEFLFGLDNLRRHQCHIDLQENVLRFPTTGVALPFLPEHEIPKDDLTGERDLSSPGSAMHGADPGSGGGAAPTGVETQASAPPPPSATTDGETRQKVERLMALGFSQAQCEAALQAAAGNEEVAGALLFGGL